MVDSAGPYPLPAFNFVQEGLTFTSNNVFREPDPMGLRRWSVMSRARNCAWV